MARSFIKRSIGIAALVGAVFVAGWLWYIAQPAADAGQEVEFTVEEGMGVRAIGGALAEADLIRSPWYFVWKVKMLGVSDRLQAGKFMLSPAYTAGEIIDRIATGGATGRERAVTIIEGWRITTIAAYLEAEGFGAADDFVQLAGSWCERAQEPCAQYDFLADMPAEIGLEGFLFPDTYRVYQDASFADIIEVMLDNFDRKLTPQMRADIAASDLSLYDTVILASMIEKEVRTADDMALVSGIFHNRLDINMGLQSDATLTYYFGNKTAAHSGAELAVDTPFNTYKYRGLPPTPIASPGLNALRAAVYPAQTDYLYFLSDTETGETYFAETLEKHNENKRRYVR